MTRILIIETGITSSIIMVTDELQSMRGRFCAGDDCDGPFSSFFFAKKSVSNSIRYIKNIYKILIQVDMKDGEKS